MAVYSSRFVEGKGSSLINGQPHDIKWTISHLLTLTTIVAILCAGVLWLGRDDHRIAVIPLCLSAVVLVVTRGRTWIGACVGAFAFASFSTILNINAVFTDRPFFKTIVSTALFGTLMGASIHSLRLKRYFLGSFGFLVGFLLFSITCLTVDFRTKNLRLISTGKVTQKRIKTLQTTETKAESSVNDIEPN